MKCLLIELLKTGLPQSSRLASVIDYNRSELVRDITNFVEQWTRWRVRRATTKIWLILQSNAILEPIIDKFLKYFLKMRTSDMFIPDRCTVIPTRRLYHPSAFRFDGVIEMNGVMCAIRIEQDESVVFSKRIRRSTTTLKLLIMPEDKSWLR